MVINHSLFFTIFTLFLHILFDDCQDLEMFVGDKQESRHAFNLV